jgi:hypothetical protein
MAICVSLKWILKPATIALALMEQRAYLIQLQMELGMRLRQFAYAGRGLLATTAVQTLTTALLIRV